MKEILGLGVMSGTSLDGIDLALCRFAWDGDEYSYSIVNGQTIEYDDQWRKKLTDAYSRSPFDLVQIDKEYGQFLGDVISEYLTITGIRPDFIASHGHTTHHEPSKGITRQIGDGNLIHLKTEITTISDFRTLDVSLGGQGAPLVPIGDLYLFKEYEGCINLGGFANVSLKANGMTAFDLCPVNIVMNDLAVELGLKYDDEGQIARQGTVNQELLEQLNALSFYNLKGSKSLGREWVEENVSNLIAASESSIPDLMATWVRHVAIQIGNQLAEVSGKLLVTGGGTFNTYLIEEMRDHLPHVELVIPDKKTIEFKEALIFAFLGLRALEGKTNTLASVTGAKQDSCGGRVFGNNPVGQS